MTKSTAIKHEREQLEEMKDLLETRLRQKTDGKYYLDFRCEPFIALGRSTQRLRDPYDPEWPLRGRSTWDDREAKKWTRAHYASYILKELEQRRTIGAPLTVRQAARKYEEAQLERVGGDGMELRSLRPRLTVLRKHVIPHFGDETLVNLTAQRVREVVGGLTVTPKKRSGQRAAGPRPMARGTRRNVLNALGALWQHTYPDHPSPFRGARSMFTVDRVEARRKLRAGDDLDALRGQPKSLTTAELGRILLAALYYDQVCQSRPNLRRRYVWCTAAIIAVAVCCGLRIIEVVGMQWHDVRWDEDELEIRGTKSKASFRRVPLQRALRPWLERHREAERARLGREPRPHEPLFYTTPGLWKYESTLKNAERRWTRVLDIAELTLPGKATHWARASFATLVASSEVVPNDWMRFYLGHSDAFGETTSDYMDRLKVPLPAAHATAISLPDPAELEAIVDSGGELDGFCPTWRPKRPRRPA